MRPLALGRRNWIHIGNEQANKPDHASGYNLGRPDLPTTKNPHPLLSWLDLARLANFPINRIAELTRVFRP